MKRRIWLLVLGIALGGALTLVVTVRVIRVQKETAARSTVLPDGTRVKLLGVSVGAAEFSTEKPWHPIARRWLPQRLQSWIPASITTSSRHVDSGLTLWFELTDAKGAIVGGSLPWTWYAAAGEGGFQYPPMGGSGSSSSGGKTVWSFGLTAFPRRQSAFEWQMLGANYHMLGSIKVPNPIRGPFPEWTPGPLPIRHTKGPLVVTLQSLSVKESNKLRPPWVVPEWTLETSDPQWRGARPSSFEYEDATGNRGGFLPFQERAWKLKLPFRRPNPADYGAAEKFAVTNLAVAKPGSLQSLDLKFERLGVKFNVLCLVGAGTLTLTNGPNRVVVPPTPGQRSSGWSSGSDGRTKWEKWGSDQPFFLIEVSNVGPLDELRFRLVHADGREIPLTANGWHGRGTNDTRVYQEKFPEPDTDSPLALEVIVSRALLFEFVFDPAEIRRSKATEP